MHGCHRRSFQSCSTPSTTTTGHRIFAHSHERAVNDFTTALVVLRSKQEALRKTNFRGSGTFRESSSRSAAREDEEGVAGGDGMDLAAKSDQDHNNKDDNPRAKLPEISGAADTTTCRGGNDRQDRTNPADNRRQMSRGGDDRKNSQSNSEGGDGMSEGGSVLGACHYAR